MYSNPSISGHFVKQDQVAKRTLIYNMQRYHIFAKCGLFLKCRYIEFSPQSPHQGTGKFRLITSVYVTFNGEIERMGTGGERTARI
jgi:hypothetical protein